MNSNSSNSSNSNSNSNTKHSCCGCDGKWQFCDKNTYNDINVYFNKHPKSYLSSPTCKCGCNNIWAYCINNRENNTIREDTISPPPSPIRNYNEDSHIIDILPLQSNMDTLIQNGFTRVHNWVFDPNSNIEV